MFKRHIRQDFVKQKSYGNCKTTKFMKTISDYTIRCTPAQTRKALELGVPIESGNDVNIYDNKEDTNLLYKFPTAEQMIGWLEEQGVTFEVILASKKFVYFTMWRIDDRGARPIVGRSASDFPSRSEATLAAIDAALEYLITHENEK